MDTLEIAVLICFGLFLKMALTIVAVYKLRLPSSNGTRKLKREGGQRKESARELNTESRPVLKSASGRVIHKRAISSGGKPLKLGLAASEPQPEELETWKSAHSESVGPWSGRKRMPTRNKAGEQTAPGEVRTQAQPKNTAPVGSSEPKVALKDDSVKHTAVVGAPQPQAAFTVSRSGQKPATEPLTDTVEPAITIKNSENSTDIEPDIKDNQASSEPPAETADSGETDQEMSQKQKSGLGDLADLFATSASDFSEKSKLAEQVNDVDVDDILQEGLGLLSKVKKSDG